MDKKIVNPEYLSLINELLELTTFLEQEYVFAGMEAYPPFLEATARKSYYYLYSLRQLAEDEKNGDAVIDLSRSLLESLITVMFVQEFGKEDKAKRFLLYAPVETWGDRQYALETNIDLPADALEERLKEFNSVKGDYLRPTKKEIAEKNANKALRVLADMEVVLSEEQREKFVQNMIEGKSDEEIINKSPLGVDLETMIDELDKIGKFPGNLRASFERIYVYGNRKNHLSSNDLNLLLDKIERVKRNIGYHMNIGLHVSLISYIMLMIELAELQENEELKMSLEKIKEKLLQE